MCGHRRAAVEAFLGRVSKGQKSVAVGEAVTKGVAVGKAERCWASLEIEAGAGVLLCRGKGMGG